MLYGDGDVGAHGGRARWGPRDTDSGRGRRGWGKGPEGRMRDGVCHAMQCMMQTRTKSGVMGEIWEWEQECEWERE